MSSPIASRLSLRALPLVLGLVGLLVGSGAAAAAPGDLDPSWTGCGTTAATACTSGNGLAADAYQVRVQSDGQVLVANGSDTFDGSSRGGRFVRLGANGAIDPNWPTVAGFAGTSTFASAVASDGRIYVGGQFTAYTTASGSLNRFSVARLSATGNLETAWIGCAAATSSSCDAASGLNAQVQDVEVLSDNSLLVAGGFQFFNGAQAGGAGVAYQVGVSRLTNAAITPAWTCRGGVEYGRTVYALAVLADGDILIGGDFTWYGNWGPASNNTCVTGDNTARVTRSLVARLNPDGSLDTTWTGCVDAQNAVAACDGTNGLNTSGTTVRAIEVQQDGKILVGGSFTSLNGVSANYLVRLNADGTRDTTFAPTGAGLSGTVRSIALHPTGRIFAGGDFNLYNFAPCRKVARLLPDGALDPSFTCSALYDGGSSIVHSVAYDAASRRLFVGGSFTSIGGTNRNYVAALSGASAPSAPQSPTATAGDLSADVAWSAPADDDGLAITAYTVTGTPGGTCSTSGATTCTVTGLTAGTSYSFTVTATTSAGTGSPSAATAPVVVVGAPDAPTGLAATAGDGSASIAFTAGADNGSAIANYEYSLDGGSWAALSPADAASPVTIPGLANGTAYAVRLRAVNGVGAGAASAPVSVTPAGPPDPGPSPAPRATVAIRSQVVGAVGVSQRVRVSGAGVVRIRGTLLGAGRRLAPGDVVCYARTTTTRAEAVAIACVLNPAARRMLESRSVRVRLVTTFAPQSGDPVARTREVRFARFGPEPQPVTG